MSFDSEIRRKEYRAAMAEVFVELGYRGATTAILAQRVGVRENVLYRFWPTKRDMFIAAVDHIFQITYETWQQVLRDAPEGAGRVQALLDHQARDHGKLRLYRLVFAGLLEDDPVIRAALQGVYRRFHALIVGLLSASMRRKRDGSGLCPDEAAWALIGLGSVVDLQRELDLSPQNDRSQFIQRVGRYLLQ